MHAVSGALPQPERTDLISPAPIADGSNPQVRPDQNSSPRIQQTGPHTHESQAWTLGDTPPVNGELSLSLQNVATISVDMQRAGLAEREDWEILVSNDTPTTTTQLTLTQLTDGQHVNFNGTTLAVENGQIVLDLVAGGNTISRTP